MNGMKIFSGFMFGIAILLFIGAGYMGLQYYMNNEITEVDCFDRYRNKIEGVKCEQIGDKEIGQMAIGNIAAGCAALVLSAFLKGLSEY